MFGWPRQAHRSARHPLFRHTFSATPALSTTLVDATSSTAFSPNAVIILTACLFSTRTIRWLSAFVPTVVTGTGLLIRQIFEMLLDIGGLVFREVVAIKKILSKLLLILNVVSGSVGTQNTPEKATHALRGIRVSPLMSIVTKYQV